MIEVKIECAELLHAHRLLSLSTVESIIKWQEHIQHINSLTADRQKKPLPVFLWGELNYLSKIRDDLDFLAYSELAKIFKFSKRRDPFMILPSKGAAKGKSSYFIEGNEIIIPLPSLLMRRIQLAETVIFHENNQETTGNAHLPPHRNSISLRTKIELKSDETSPKSEIRKETRKITKAEALQEHILAEMIYRSLLEDEIESEGLEDYAQIFIHRAIDKRKTTITNAAETASLAAKEYELRITQLSQLLYKNLTKEFVSGDWLSELSKVVYFNETTKRVEVEDNAMEVFTPHIHSPNEYSIEQSPVSAKALHPQLEFEFAIGIDYPSMKYIQFFPSKVYDNSFGYVVYEYMQLLPNEIRSLLLGSGILEDDCVKGVDICWYWGVIDNKAVGMVVYGVDPYVLCERKIEIIHISCFNPRHYQKFVEMTCNFIWGIDPCDEIKVKLYHKIDSDLPQGIKTVYNNLKFRWKADRLAKEVGLELTVMSITRPQPQYKYSLLLKNPTVRVRSSISIDTREGAIPVNTQPIECMGISDTRKCMIMALLELVKGKTITSTGKTGVLLQDEVFDLLHRVTQAEQYDFDHMECQAKLDNSIATFSLDFSWISCTNITHEVAHLQYRFLRFKTHRIKCFWYWHYKLFIVPLSIDDIAAVFVCAPDLTNEINSETHKQHYDPSYKLSQIYQKVKDFPVVCTELTVPAFKLNTETKVPWIEGLRFLPQSEEEKLRSVFSCHETVLVELSPPPQSAGHMKSKLNHDFLLEEDFAFSLISTATDRPFDIPVLTTFIRYSNWILS